MARTSPPSERKERKRGKVIGLNRQRQLLSKRIAALVTKGRKRGKGKILRRKSIANIVAVSKAGINVPKGEMSEGAFPYESEGQFVCTFDVKKLDGNGEENEAEEYRSSVEMIGNLPWRVNIMKSQEEEEEMDENSGGTAQSASDAAQSYLMAAVVCNEESIAEGWSCTFTLDVTVIPFPLPQVKMSRSRENSICSRGDATVGTRSVTEEMLGREGVMKFQVDEKFTVDNNDKEKSLQFISWKDLNDPSKRFVEDGQVTVVVNVHILSCVGVIRPRLFSFDAPMEGTNTLTLIFPRSSFLVPPLHVCRDLLCIRSPYFSKLLLSSASAVTTVKIFDATRAEMEKLMKMLYSPYEEIDCASLPAILGLAHRFEISDLVERLAEQLLVDESLPADHKLFLMGKYGLRQQESRAITSLLHSGQLQDVKESELFNTFDMCSKVSILKAALESKEEEPRAAAPDAMSIPPPETLMTMLQDPQQQPQNSLSQSPHFLAQKFLESLQYTQTQQTPTQTQDSFALAKEILAPQQYAENQQTPPSQNSATLAQQDTAAQQHPQKPRNAPSQGPLTQQILASAQYSQATEATSSQNRRTLSQEGVAQQYPQSQAPMQNSRLLRQEISAAVQHTQTQQTASPQNHRARAMDTSSTQQYPQQHALSQSTRPRLAQGTAPSPRYPQQQLQNASSQSPRPLVHGVASQQYARQLQATPPQNPRPLLSQGTTPSPRYPQQARNVPPPDRRIPLQDTGTGNRQYPQPQQRGIPSGTPRPSAQLTMMISRPAQPQQPVRNAERMAQASSSSTQHSPNTESDQYIQLD